MGIYTKEKEEKMKKILVLICFFIIIFFVGFIIILKSLGHTTNTKEWLYSYTVERNITYKVNLKDNVFYDSNSIGMNKEYVAALINDIDINYTYKFMASKPEDIQYKYKIIGDLNIKYSNGTSNSASDIIWSKEYELLPEEIIKLNGTELIIDKNVNINYKEYQKQIDKFKQNFETPIIAYLDVKLIISTETNLDRLDESMNKYQEINLTIPLNQEVLTMTENYDKSDEKSIYSDEKVETKTNKLQVIFGAIIISISLIGMIGTIRKNIKQSAKSDYEIALNKILRTYGDIVVEVVSPVDLEDDMQIIIVKDFEQMLDIEEEIRMPILFYETVAGKQGEFVIIYDNNVYKYIIGD